MIVSVLMPTYNRLESLKKSIESFINQDYDKAYLFILNNGSTDGTKDWLNSLNHPRIKIAHSNVNLTPPENFNTLLHNYAFGDLICHLHDDDKLTKDSISSRVEYFKNNPDTEVLYANWITNGQERKSLKPDKDRIIKEEYINFLTMMWRSSVNATFDNDLRYYHDWMFKIECFINHKVSYLDKAVIDYAVHPGQASIECRKLGMNGPEERLMREKLTNKYESINFTINNR